MSTDRKRVEESNKHTEKDRSPKQKQPLADDNQELQNKISNKQAPNDTDKGGLSAQQRAATTPAGGMERESVSEAGTDKKVKKTDK